MKPDYDYLTTELQKGNPGELESKRIKRINEALSWKAGPSLDDQRKYVVNKLPNGMEVYFLKPGKEAFRKENPNVNDMTPGVGPSGETYKFLDVWKQLSKISVHDFDAFKSVLTLVYRNAYMLDHIEVKAGIVRYQPEQGVLECIDDLEKRVGSHLEYGLFGLLNFMDILGWNEDVKYQVADGKPKLGHDDKWKVGRVNTLLTCINVPCKSYCTVKNIIENSKSLKDVDWDLVYDTLQTMMRGVSPPKQTELANWLSPHIRHDKVLKEDAAAYNLSAIKFDA